MKTLRFGAILALAAATTFACSGNDDDSKKTDTGVAGDKGNDDGGAGEGAGGAPAEAAPLELIGEYSNDFDGEEVITAEKWNDAAIVGYDNAANVVYTQQPDDAMFNASKFVKTVYTEPKDGSFYYCMVVFDAETLEAAKASEATADDSDPASGGCGGKFPWTKATKK